jgi:hypothetical protein
MGPLTLPPRAMGVLPVQNMQTYTGGRLLLLMPMQLMCSHLLHDSHWTVERPSSPPLQTQRVLSPDMLLRSVDGVVALLAGDAMNELLNGSKKAVLIFARSADA